jgi:hypothetical protein
MNFHEDRNYLFNELSEVIGKIKLLMINTGENPNTYKELKHIQNIVDHRDVAGIKNTKKYLDDLFRIIYDNRIATSSIEKLMNDAYVIIDKIKSFC